MNTFGEESKRENSSVCFRYADAMRYLKRDDHESASQLSDKTMA